MKVYVTFTIEEERELELEIPDEDGFTNGDLLEAARRREPFTDFVAVVAWDTA